MIQITPQMRVLVAVEPADFRRGIDGLAQLCRTALQQDPFEGTLFVFRNRIRSSVKLLVYDGQGFWLCQKRLSAGRFRWWPSAAGTATPLQAHELQVLLSAGDPSATRAAPVWRRVEPKVLGKIGPAGSKPVDGRSGEQRAIEIEGRKGHAAGGDAVR